MIDKYCHVEYSYGKCNFFSFIIKILYKIEAKAIKPENHWKRCKKIEYIILKKQFTSFFSPTCIQLRDLVYTMYFGVTLLCSHNGQRHCHYQLQPKKILLQDFSNLQHMFLMKHSACECNMAAKANFVQNSKYLTYY